jgi:hypothetical protein
MRAGERRGHRWRGRRVPSRRQKSMDAEAAAEFEQPVRATYDQMARIAITPA